MSRRSDRIVILVGGISRGGEAIIETFAGDGSYIVQVDVKLNSGKGADIWVRRSDADNGYVIRLDGTNITLYDVDYGNYSSVSSVAYTTAASVAVKVKVKAKVGGVSVATIKAWVDGTLVGGRSPLKNKTATDSRLEHPHPGSANPVTTACEAQAATSSTGRPEPVGEKHGPEGGVPVVAPGQKWRGCRPGAASSIMGAANPGHPSAGDDRNRPIWAADSRYPSTTRGAASVGGSQ